MRSDFKYLPSVVGLVALNFIVAGVLLTAFDNKIAGVFISTVFCVSAWAEHLGMRIRDDVVNELKGFKDSKQSDESHLLNPQEKR